MKRYLLMLLMVVFISPAVSQDDLERYLPQDQLHWLTGDDDERYLALKKEYLQAFERGQMVLLPDWYYHPLQSFYIRPIYENAPDFGWTTWALTPPDHDIRTDNLQTPATTTHFPEAADEEVFTPPVNALQQRMTLLLDETLDRPGFSVWVVEGITADITLRLLESEPSIMPDAIVLVNAYVPQFQYNRALADRISQSQLPVLDIRSAESNRWVSEHWALRKKLASKYQHPAYRQRQLVNSGNTGQSELISTIKGWLEFHGF
ncbi:DUF3530 family protein [Idiomarina sp. PL1-037]|uniref:DUF3530 family protein n=1 Tax=unclassified Idiomarina TaxID=2614829 RepID=UPI00294AB03E|nr:MULTISPECIES: DUF3530 family protein [unclassified Idiomarina]MDV6327539.1 DUF3530 family protein [Idiomarina sp. Sol25]WQC52641.1 DUF3530 family protein [Idiomarina sp. PL1-037]